MARNEMKVTLVNKVQFEVPGYCSWKTEIKTIYKMKDADGKIFVWKTTGSLGKYIRVPGKKNYNFSDKDGCPLDWIGVEVGDEITITATVKGESEYKGEQQTELTRVKLVEINVSAADKRAEKKADKEQKKQEQLESLKGEDFIWNMPYKQYKEHYSDCETVIDSYKEHVDSYGFIQSPPTIQVIIREGRLKASGVRGRHYAGYRIRYTIDGKSYVEPFRAVCERTAINQAKKARPEATDFELVEIIYYNQNRD